MRLLCTLESGKKAVKIFQMENGKFWPMKFNDFETKTLTIRNSMEFSILHNALKHANEFLKID